MVPEELLTLSSNEFGKNCKETFLKWWEDKDFADVTLATSDDCQISGHKIVLSSSSQLFRSLLLKNPHSHPIVYLQGVTMKQLKSVLEYIYRGECDIQQDDLDQFLNLGKELLVTGLTEVEDFNPKSEPVDIKSVIEVTSTKENSIPDNSTDQIDLPDSVSANTAESLFPCKNCDYTTKFSHNMTKHFNAKHTDLMHECSLCDSKYSWKQQLRNHIESIHEGKHKIGNGKRKKCTQCDFSAANNATLRVHTENFHEGKRYYCNQCDFNVAHSMNLTSHIQIVHEGIRYECNECDYKTTQRKYLKTHTESTHKGVRYDCHECEYKATVKSSLKRHMQTIHKPLDLKIEN